jgi:hypothetical protein
MNRFVLIGLIIALAASSIGMGIRLIYDRGIAANEKEQQDKVIAEFISKVQKSDMVNKNLEAELDAIRAEKEKLTEGWNDETTKPSETSLYNACYLPAGGLQLLNQSRAGISQSTVTR